MKWLLMLMLMLLTACSRYTPQYTQAFKSAEAECAQRGGIRDDKFYADNIGGVIYIDVKCKDNVALKWMENVKKE